MVEAGKIEAGKECASQNGDNTGEHYKAGGHDVI